MIVKVELADGTTDIFESQNYNVSRVKDFHPAIVSVSVFDNGFRIKKAKRPFIFWYKHVTFKSERIQDQLKQIAEAEVMKNEPEKKAE